MNRWIVSIKEIICYYLKKKVYFVIVLFLATSLFFQVYGQKLVQTQLANEPDIFLLRSGFLNPPDSARPGVYWYFMDGNLSKKGMKKDLEPVYLTIILSKFPNSLSPVFVFISL